MACAALSLHLAFPSRGKADGVKTAKRNGARLIENKRSRENHDSLLTTISMAYDQRCEALRFVQRNPISFVRCLDALAFETRPNARSRSGGSRDLRIRKALRAAPIASALQRLRT